MKDISKELINQLSENDSCTVIQFATTSSVAYERHFMTSQNKQNCLQSIDNLILEEHLTGSSIDDFNSTNIVSALDLTNYIIQATSNPDGDQTSHVIMFTDGYDLQAFFEEAVENPNWVNEDAEAKATGRTDAEIAEFIQKRKQDMITFNANGTTTRKNRLELINNVATAIGVDQKVPIHTIGLHNSHDVSMLQTIASQSGGKYIHVPQLSLNLSKMISKILTIVAKEIKLSFTIDKVNATNIIVPSSLEVAQANTRSCSFSIPFLSSQQCFYFTATVPKEFDQGSLKAKLIVKCEWKNTLLPQVQQLSKSLDLTSQPKPKNQNLLADIAQITASNIIKESAHISANDSVSKAIIKLDQGIAEPIFCDQFPRVQLSLHQIVLSRNILFAREKQVGSSGKVSNVEYLKLVESAEKLEPSDPVSTSQIENGTRTVVTPTKRKESIVSVTNTPVDPPPIPGIIQMGGRDRHAMYVQSPEDILEALRFEQEQIMRGRSIIIPRGANLTHTAATSVCPVCLDVCGTDANFWRRCTHPGHSACFKRQIQNMSQDRNFPICCITCKQPTTVKDWERFLNKEELLELARVYLDSLVRTNPDKYANCRTPDCPAVREITPEEKASCQYDCKVCLKQYCLRCDVLYHENMSCEEFQRFDQENRAAQQYMTELMESGVFKKCAHCDITIMKVDGCNYVVCGSCKTPICWQTGLRRSQCGGGHNCH